MALRNPGDDREAATRPATMNDLRFHQEKPIGLAKPSEPPKSEVQQASYTEIHTLRGLDAGSVRIAIPR